MEKLEYAELTKNYLHSLNVNLRNFSVGPEYLETWVHDENHETSIYGIFESAKDFGQKEALLVVDEKTALELDQVRLVESLKNLGAVEIRNIELGGFEIRMQFEEKNKPTRELKMHDIFLNQLREAESKIAREGFLKDGFQFQKGDLTLTFHIDSNHVVVKANHQGAKAETRILLDQLCQVLEGRTFQEGHDHGMNRLMNKLKDPDKKNPIVGILTPDNADPAFAPVQTLLREAFTKYCETKPYKPLRNFWDDKASEKWLKLSKEERMRFAQEQLISICKSLGLQQTGVEVVDIMNDVRIVLNFKQDPSKPTLGEKLMKIERLLNDGLNETRLELQLEDLADSNKRKERSKIIAGIESKKTEQEIQT